MPSVLRQRRSLSIAAVLATNLLVQSASGASPSDEVAQARASSIRAAVSGCMAAIIDPAVMGYMQRAEEAGKPFASVADARADLTGNPRWKTEMEPMIRTACECSMKSDIDSIQSAGSAEAIQKIFSDVQKRLSDPASAEAEAAKFERCVQSLVEKLDEKR